MQQPRESSKLLFGWSDAELPVVSKNKYGIRKLFGAALDECPKSSAQKTLQPRDVLRNAMNHHSTFADDE